MEKGDWSELRVFILAELERHDKNIEYLKEHFDLTIPMKPMANSKSSPYRRPEMLRREKEDILSSG